MKVNLNSKKGQNTAEYLIMLTLVAVASIGLFSVFGQTLRQKIAMVSGAISGNTTVYTSGQTGADTASTTASTRGAADVGMNGIGSDELSSGAGGGAAPASGGTPAPAPQGP
jgi:Flp pilus assembly pilin Flp